MSLLLLVILLLELHHHETSLSIAREIPSLVRQDRQPDQQQKSPRCPDARRHTAVNHGLLPPRNGVARQETECEREVPARLP